MPLRGLPAATVGAWHLALLSACVGCSFCVHRLLVFFNSSCSAGSKLHRNCPLHFVHFSYLFRRCLYASRLAAALRRRGSGLGEEEEEVFITSGKWRGKHNSLSRGAGADQP